MVLHPGTGLTRKYWTKLERLNRDKRSSLLQKFVTYFHKSFITLAAGVNVAQLFAVAHIGTK
jgi:hypothetical protein